MKREAKGPSGRLLSLDALRGFDMLMIMGVEGVVMSLCAACGWGTDCWLAQQFQHVEWNGLRFEDTLFHWLIDVCGYVRWTFFFRVIGMNSITIYLTQQFVPFDTVAKNFLGGAAGLLPAVWGDVLLSVGAVAVGWLFLFFLYRKNVFLKV